MRSGRSRTASASSPPTPDAFFTDFTLTKVFTFTTKYRMEARLERRATMIFDVVSRVVDDPRSDERRMFARVPYVQPGT